MCGIVGINAFNGAPVERDQLRNMVAMLRHRGPDASGIHVSGSIGLAHARLSIIDLVGGAQPMSTHDKRFWITFNGEIFNYLELREELISKGHRFLTRSDTEVILEAYRQYGEDCVRHFNGQWAFAIWDERERKLFLSRDRLGVRPLFYTLTPIGFVFASEIKALLACPCVEPHLDIKALDQIFTFWVTLAPRTAFKDIWQLPPGCSLTVQNEELRVSRYWSLEYHPDEFANRNEETLAEELHDLLLDAARIRLRSDVPVGAYLSGGIDSTVITALISKVAGDRLRTFSVSFEDAEFDESSYQREASAFLGTQHTDVRCSNEDIGRVFPDVILHAEQPIIRTAPAPLLLLSRHVRQSGYKVVLTGEGADEILGGYDIFKEIKIREFWSRRRDSKWRPLLLKRLYPYMENIQRQSPAYLKSFFRVTAQDLESPFCSHLPRWELTSKLKMLLSSDVKAQLQQCDAMAELEQDLPACYNNWNRFSRAEYLESMYLLPGYILSSQGDRMAMAHSVEGRYPFLDYRVMEFAAKLPGRLKMKVLDQKHLLKLASRNLIPDSILKRAKQPYRAPDGKSFFGGNVPEYVEELLSPGHIQNSNIFDPTAVSALVNKFKLNRAIGTKDNMALVGVLSTQLVLDRFIKHSQEYEQCTQTSLTKYANSL